MTEEPPHAGGRPAGATRRRSCAPSDAETDEHEEGSEVPTETEDGDSAAVPDQEAESDHLEGVADGCGCAEIWEHLSERRADD